MKVLTKRTARDRWTEEEIPNELKALQKYVGGHIEPCGIAADMVLLCNEEGRINGLPYNTRILGEDFFGPILVCGKDGEEFADVPISLEGWVRHWAGGADPRQQQMDLRKLRTMKSRFNQKRRGTNHDNKENQNHAN